jgi:hypothetical protein
MFRDFDYMLPSRHAMIAYRAGITYPKQPEAAVQAILEAEAGEVVRAPAGLKATVKAES